KPFDDARNLDDTGSGFIGQSGLGPDTRFRRFWFDPVRRHDAWPPPLFCWRPTGASRILRIEDNTGIPTRKDKNATLCQKRHYLCTMCMLRGRSRRKERLQDRSDVIANHKIGDFVEIGCFPVYDHELGTAALRQKREPGGRPNHQRRADGDERVAGLRQVLRWAPLRLGHRLPERDRGRLYIAAASGTVGRAAVSRLHALSHPRELVALGAIETMREGRIAV